jgi:hypothetical protein
MKSGQATKTALGEGLLVENQCHRGKRRPRCFATTSKKTELNKQSSLMMVAPMLARIVVGWKIYSQSDKRVVENTLTQGRA